MKFDAEMVDACERISIGASLLGFTYHLKKGLVFRRTGKPQLFLKGTKAATDSAIAEEVVLHEEWKDLR